MGCYCPRIGILFKVVGVVNLGNSISGDGRYHKIPPSNGSFCSSPDKMTDKEILHAFITNGDCRGITLCINCPLFSNTHCIGSTNDWSLVEAAVKVYIEKNDLSPEELGELFDRIL